MDGDGNSGRWLFERVRRRTRRDRGIPRKRSYSQKLSSAPVVGHEYPRELAEDRPVTRGDCRDGARPCPYVSCRHHLYLDVNPHTGTLTINFPTLELWQLVETCSLDVAEREPIVLDEIGAHMNLTRERVRQIEVRALLRLRDAGKGL